MYEQVEKPKEKKSRAAINSVAQKKSNMRQGFGFVDNRSDAAVQRKLQSIITHSDRHHSGVLQLTSLNGVQVDETVRYQNNNQDNILTHMAGEWDRVKGHAVGGGHLLDSMIHNYGPAIPNSVPNGASPAGVHFESNIPGQGITQHQHRFRLVHVSQGRGANSVVSAAKDSTFWPRNWNNNNFIGMLNNSYQCGNNTQWASKENTSYWYRWQTLGGNTLFPIEKVATATGTERSRMKAGRARALAYANRDMHLNND